MIVAEKNNSNNSNNSWLNFQLTLLNVPSHYYPHYHHHYYHRTPIMPNRPIIAVTSAHGAEVTATLFVWAQSLFWYSVFKCQAFISSGSSSDMDSRQKDKYHNYSCSLQGLDGGDPNHKCCLWMNSFCGRSKAACDWAHFTGKITNMNKTWWCHSSQSLMWRPVPILGALSVSESLMGN